MSHGDPSNAIIVALFHYQYLFRFTRLLDDVLGESVPDGTFERTNFFENLRESLPNRSGSLVYRRADSEIDVFVHLPFRGIRRKTPVSKF